MEIQIGTSLVHKHISWWAGGGRHDVFSFVVTDTNARFRIKVHKNDKVVHARYDIRPTI